METVEKEFENHLYQTKCGWVDGHEWSIGDTEIDNIWQFIEQKLQQERAKVLLLPTVEQISDMAVKLSGGIPTQEQAYFVAGFQECFKYLQQLKEV